MINQKEIQISSRGRGYHLVTREIESALDGMSGEGLLHIFMKHTSAGLTLNENADPTVRDDFATFFEELIPENHPHYTHTLEGPDDMPAHLKSSVIGVSLVIPVTKGRLNLGTWQGIYLCEFRNHSSSRRLVLTMIS